MESKGPGFFSLLSWVGEGCLGGWDGGVFPNRWVIKGVVMVVVIVDLLVSFWGFQHDDGKGSFSMISRNERMLAGDSWMYPYQRIPSWEIPI